MDIKLFDSELKVMDVLWKRGDTPAKEIARTLTIDLGWNVNTTYTLIKRCMKKGAIERSEPGFLCHALIPKSAVQEAETDELINKIYDGSADKLFAALLGRKKLSAERRAALKELFKGEKGRRLSAPVPPACSVREQNWLDNYQSARLYAEKKGSLLVPAGYVDENGFRLGVWISNLRAARKARPESFQVTPEHIALLDAIGMQWDAREAKWAGAFRRAEEYRAAHGDLLVPVNYKTEDGFCLGDWVCRMRENYACAEKKLMAERIAKLEALGMVWVVPQEG